MTPEELSAWRRNPRTQEVLAVLQAYADDLRNRALEAHFGGALTVNPKRELFTAYARGAWDLVEHIRDATPEEIVGAKRKGAQGQEC